MIIRRTIFSLALIALVLGGWSPAAQASESASRFVQQLGEQAINVLQDDGISLAQREMQFRALLIEGFDLNLIGRFVLGRAWKTAGEGVARDLVEVLFWMTMAADQNLPRAVAGRDEISAGMSAADIGAARARVAAWKAGTN